MLVHFDRKPVLAATPMTTARRFNRWDTIKAITTRMFNQPNNPMPHEQTTINSRMSSAETTCHWATVHTMTSVSLLMAPTNSGRTVITMASTRQRSAQHSSVKAIVCMASAATSSIASLPVSSRRASGGSSTATIVDFLPSVVVPAGSSRKRQPPSTQQ